MKTASPGSLIVIGLGLALMAGCDAAGGDVTAQLRPLESCAAVESAIRSAALGEMNRRIDESLARALDSERCSLGEPQNQTETAAYFPSPGSAAAAANPGGASQTSATNVQISGVDEADFIKNDKTHLYVVSGQHFRIIQAWPAASARTIAKVKLEGEPRKLFVAGDRALIYAALPGATSSSSGQECTYGYSCRFTGDGRPTQITVWDIADRTAPRLVRKLRLTGSLFNARRVGSAVYTVVNSPGVVFPGLQYTPPKSLGCGFSRRWLATRAHEELRAANSRIILQTPLGPWLPSVQDTVLRGGGADTLRELLAGCGGFYRAGLADGGHFTTVLALEMTRESPASTSTIVSRPGAIYASANALYMAVPHERADSGGWFPSMSGEREASTIHKFRLSPSTATASYAASGVIKGRALNQFALDEREGHLRVASTSGQVPASSVHSTLTVLAQRGETLEQVGLVDDLAPGEDIRAVRFDGDRGYVVTFKKTDPLFVLDLSRPAAPRVLAELKIPGFSTYIHKLDDRHLLTLGYDAADQGGFAWFTGVLLQIFDVTDPKAPRLAHKELIGTRGSSSAALTNHLAFTYFAPKDLLALPMTICEGGSGSGAYGTQMSFSGLLVYEATAAGGFSLRGKVDHPAAAGVGCSNWWTDARSQVERSVFMDEYVFSVSRSLIKVNAVKDLTQDLAVVSIED